MPLLRHANESFGHHHIIFAINRPLSRKYSALLRDTISGGFPGHMELYGGNIGLFCENRRPFCAIKIHHFSAPPYDFGPNFENTKYAKSSPLATH